MNGRAAPGDECFSARHGAVSRQGKTVSLTWISFNQLGTGAPALAEWLCAQGGTGLKYDFNPGTEMDETEHD